MSVKKGREGESIAVSWYQKKGYRLLHRNFRSRIGEIDLIFLSKNQTVVFVEVKYYASSNFVHPMEMITQRKQDKIRKTALFFLIKNPIYQNLDCRFDLAIVEELGKDMIHFPGVF